MDCRPRHFGKEQEKSVGRAVNHLYQGFSDAGGDPARGSSQQLFFRRSFPLKECWGSGWTEKHFRHNKLKKKCDLGQKCPMIVFLRFRGFSPSNI